MRPSRGREISQTLSGFRVGSLDKKPRQKAMYERTLPNEQARSGRMQIKTKRKSEKKYMGGGWQVVEKQVEKKVGGISFVHKTG